MNLAAVVGFIVGCVFGGACVGLWAVWYGGRLSLKMRAESASLRDDWAKLLEDMNNAAEVNKVNKL